MREAYTARARKIVGAISALLPVPCESNADLDKHGRSTDGEKGC
jgi:hypothetical protein